MEIIQVGKSKMSKAEKVIYIYIGLRFEIVSHIMWIQPQPYQMDHLSKKKCAKICGNVNKETMNKASTIVSSIKNKGR